MSISFNERQQEILVGSILGDGFLTSSLGGNAYFRFKQCEKRQDYVFWMYEELKDFCCSGPKQRKDNQQWYFLTRCLPVFNILKDVFYPEGKKVIPDDIEGILISPLSLAVWYMDDGTLDYRPNYHCSFSFSTHSFSLKGVQRLVVTLKDNFGIESSMSNNLIRGVRYPRIYVGTKGRDRLIELISPYILDCFKYKLPQYRQPLRDFSRIKLGRWQVPENQENKLP